MLLYNRGVKYILLAMFPIVLMTITFAPEGLNLWLGQEFAHHSAPVLSWLAAGIFVNSLAYVPFVFIQSAGRPDITAKLHILQLPFYLVAVWLLTKSLGIQGTAIAWTGRVSLEMVILFVVVGRMIRPRRSYITKLVGASTLAILTLCAGAYFQGMAVKITFTVIVLALFALVTWFLAMAPDERSLVAQICTPKRLRFSNSGAP